MKNMVELQIKNESLPKRCKICHQTDYFDATNNYCIRCCDIKENKLQNNQHNFILINKNEVKALLYQDASAKLCTLV